MAWIVQKSLIKFHNLSSNVITSGRVISEKCVCSLVRGSFKESRGRLANVNFCSLALHTNPSHLLHRWFYTTSRRLDAYPDFLQNTSDKSNGLDINPARLLDILEAASEVKDYDNALKTFKKFQIERPDWQRQWPAQKIAATVLHIYLQTGRHGTLLAFYGELKKNGFEHGEGIYVTLIKCCIASHDISKALSYMEEMKSVGQRNIRVYPHVIKFLISDGRLELAFKLFKEMQEFELNQKTKKQLKDQKMLSSLLIATTTREERFLDRNCQTRKVLPEIVENVLEFIAVRGLAISQELGDAISRAVRCFEEDYEMIFVDVQDIEGKSALIGKSGQTIVSKSDLERFIAKLQSFLVNSKCSVEEQYLREFLSKHGPFGVVIDGANVLLARSQKNHRQMTKLTEKNLSGVLMECHNRSFGYARSLIIVPSTMERRSNFTQSQFYKDMKELYDVHTIVMEDIKDDIAVILACLYNDVYLANTDLDANTELLTNDSLREHISLLGEHQLQFHLWLQSKQLKFSWGLDDQVLLHRATSPTPQSGKQWMLHLKNGQMLKIVRNFKAS